MSMIGKTLAHYQITAEIGKGGMGEVYQARDTKLGREVAIKVLPEEFARDADRIARFQREAKLLASLNHPNIAAIYGLDEADGTHFLVLELIEGQTLADRIKGGPVPVEEALKLDLQIAEALEAAHEKGVIHRDLKPANIKVTPDGKVKILDFGLAKAFAGDSENINLSNSPTLSDMATQQGVILGTAAYMSPEQAKGKTVDKRTDIWAFGIVLFEMLTGRQVFTGETVSDTLASVLAREPKWQSLPPNLHPRIRFLLERCLEKETQNRYHDIADVRADIQKVLADPDGVFDQLAVTVNPGTKSRQILLWASVTVILLIVVGIVVWNLRSPEQYRMEVEYVLPADQQFNLDQWGHSYIAVSPNGRQFVYGTTKGLYLRSVDRRDTKRIPGSEDNSQWPFFSPDGKWIGYYSPADRQLKKLRISGGNPVFLCDIETSVAGVQWCPDNKIVFSLLPGGIMKIPNSGGTPEPLFQVESTESSGLPILAQILPDGKNVLFTNLSDIDGTNKQVMVQSIKTGKRKELLPGHSATYIPTGHILYSLTENSSENLYAVPFDLNKLEVTGSSVLIQGRISSLSVSESGTLAYGLQPVTISQSNNETEGTGFLGRTLWWVDRNGNEEQIPAPPKMYKIPKISPDGTKVALTVGPDLVEEIWIWDLHRQNENRLTFNETMDKVPLWTADSQRVIFMSVRGDQTGLITGIYWQAANGTGTVEPLCTTRTEILTPFSLSKDGKTLLITSALPSEFLLTNIEKVPINGDCNRELLLGEEYMEALPQISPDGQWMAYVSNESGESAIYVRPFPEVDKDKLPVSTDRGTEPRWSPDGTELFYRTGTESNVKVMAVEVEREPKFRVGKPKVLFSGNYVINGVEGIGYDIDPKTKKFLMIKPSGTESQLQTEDRDKIIAVTNWFEELK